MIILPERSAPRGRALLPLRRADWCGPSQRVSAFDIENRRVFVLQGRIDDGHVVWRGRFDDREDADAFLFALASGSLLYERELWRLPTPSWHPDLGLDLFYEFVAAIGLTSTPGSNNSFTSPADWTNNRNTVSAIGAGAGGAGINTVAGHGGSGAGAGACSLMVNFTFAVPGVTTATYRAGVAGTHGAINADGAAGGDTWFNDTAFPTTGNGKVGAKGGTAGLLAGTAASGGAAASGYAVNSDGSAGTKYSGGSSGTATAGAGSSGGGGAAGPNGAGGNSASVSTTDGTTGGTADNGTVPGGAGSNSGSQSGQSGSSGTEWFTFGVGSGAGGGYWNIGVSSGQGGTAAGFGGAGGGGGGTQGGGDGFQGGVFLLYYPPIIFMDPRRRIYVRR